MLDKYWKKKQSSFVIEKFYRWYCVGRARRDGQMFSAMDLRSRGLGMIPGWVNVLYSWEIDLALTAPFSIQGYEWVTTNYQESLVKC